MINDPYVCNALTGPKIARVCTSHFAFLDTLLSSDHLVKTYPALTVQITRTSVLRFRVKLTTAAFAEPKEPMTIYRLHASCLDSVSVHLKI